MSAKETGKALGISPHTVAMHWRSAERKLRLDPQQRVDEEADPAVSPDWHADQTEPGELYSWTALLVLGFGALSILLTALGWALLYFSPVFAHMWR